MAVFYELPATELVTGVSTDDAQDVLAVERRGNSVIAEVYTPRPDDPDADDHNRANSESRIYGNAAYASLGVFPDTAVDLSRHPQARNYRETAG